MLIYIKKFYYNCVYIFYFFICNSYRCLKAELYTFSFYFILFGFFIINYIYKIHFIYFEILSNGDMLWLHIISFVKIFEILLSLIVSVDSFITFDLPISLLFMMILGLLIFLSYNGVFYIVSGSGQFILEFFYKIALLDIVKKYLHVNLWEYFYFLFFLLYFLFIWNIFGLFPYGHPPTFYMTITLFLSMCVWVITLVNGLYRQKFLFLKVVISDVMLAMVPIIMLLEMFSYVMRILTLAVRLSANIIAGHTILFVVSGFFINMFDIGIDLILFCAVVLLILISFELFVCGLQAYIFVVLSCLYLNDIVGGH